MSSRKNIQVREGNGHTLIALEGNLEAESLEALKEQAESIVALGKPVVLQCSTVESISLPWIRAILSLQQSLGKKKIPLRVVNVSYRLMLFFKEQGMDTAFEFRDTLPKALADFGIRTKKSIDTDFVNPFLLATVKLLEVQAGVKSVAGKVFLKTATEMSGDISGVIGLLSDSFSGTVVISFPEKTYLSLVSRMYGVEQVELTKQNQETAAEITNIIFGQAKVILNEKGYGIKSALPSVVIGRDHIVASTEDGVTVVVPFESDAGSFFVEITTAVS